MDRDFAERRDLAERIVTWAGIVGALIFGALLTVLLSIHPVGG